MTRRSSKFLIHPGAHLVLRPDGEPNGDDPWILSFANGPVTSDEAEHQPVTIALSDGGADLELEFFQWMADQLAGALGVDLILPEDNRYIRPNGQVMVPLTPAMKARYPSTAEYLTDTEPEESTLLHEYPVIGEEPIHDDSPYNIHHKHDAYSEDEEE